MKIINVMLKEKKKQVPEDNEHMTEQNYTYCLHTYTYNKNYF